MELVLSSFKLPPCSLSPAEPVPEQGCPFLWFPSLCVRDAVLGFWDKAPLPVQGLGGSMGGGAAKGHQGPFSFLPTPFGAGAAQVGRCLHPGWQLAHAMLSLPSQLRLMSAIWNEPPTPSPCSQGAPRGFQAVTGTVTGTGTC